MPLTVQEISGILTITVVVLTVLGVLKSRKSQKTETPRSEPTLKTEPTFKTEPIIEEIPVPKEEVTVTVINKEEEIPAPPQVISVTLLAEKTRPYGGHELLQALLSNGLRFGHMKIFHYYKDSNTKGPALFSCASAKKPGTFDMKEMGTFKIPGLSFFIQLDHEIDNAAALDAMLSTADLIVYDLGGHLIDEQHQILSDEKIAQWRKQIREFEQSTQEIFA